MKERMKTVSVALVLCLNVGVDPPDIVKTQPCARLECWIDPLSQPAQKALEMIGAKLLGQYERWQSRARYKQCLDPTVEEVKKLCTSLRRNAKEERVLFHYNGHGVPRPTVNGEIWVFNKSFTQYIPLSVYDLQQWMGTPSIYVYDCSCAGIIVESFKQFALQREQELELASMNGRGTGAIPPQQSYKNCIQLAACGSKEILPMNPDLPADLFTSCLTTPIRIALRWFVLQNAGKLVPNISLELIDKIPGQLNDRRTMLGELNWIFTAITDTIAWNTLPRDLFQKLFRQDLVVASLFRNFLLAERIMRSYDCTPISSPNLPSTHQHPMWQAWDLALDICLSQLPVILNEGETYRHSLFFAEQLTAFQVWLSFGSQTRSPPEQLPIVLQVLLSQVHRLRALELLGRFLDLGPWAVSLALSVGIFPYVLKLLQSSARELRPLLVFIWAKILAVDSTCQTDLVKDNGHKYFLSVLADPCMPVSITSYMILSVISTTTQATAGGSTCGSCGSDGSLVDHGFSNLRHAVSTSALSSIGGLHGNVYQNMWRAILQLLCDPYPEVTELTATLVTHVHDKAAMATQHVRCRSVAAALSAPSSPINRLEGGGGTPPPFASHSPPADAARPMFQIGEGSSPKNLPAAPLSAFAVHSAHFSRTRKLFDTGPEVIKEDCISEDGTPLKKEPVIATEFVAWSCRHFSQSLMKLPDEQDPQSERHQQREWRYERNEVMRADALNKCGAAMLHRLDDQRFINKNPNVPTCVRFHPYEPLVCVADKDGISTWNWEQGIKKNYFYNKNPKFTQISTMEIINGHDSTLLLTGTDDGAVRVWKNYCTENNTGLHLVTAWQALSDMLPSTRVFGARHTGSGMVTAWEQETNYLYASGDVRVIRIYDSQKEMKAQDIPTQANSCITSITCDSSNRSLLVAGCGDGLVRLYDRRLPPTDSLVLTLREHSGWVVSVHLQRRGDGKIISSSVGGDVKIWDPRFSESVMTIRAAQGLTAMDMHAHADVMACGSVNQNISIYNMMGDCLSTIKYHDGFMGQRIGPIRCLSFHPYKLNLAAGYTDYFISVYAADKKR
ncbi:PREDICTED: regulatory-associated protein of mTOR-like [Priapulus caudatus]|uniref:Regulatory-associated protein of mTOR-like n=1 Tax=Priapulus caudatus TaxID=37621 RepID=A0ABM1F9S6_PRICU|nr:PREDICTED: regulatory-associated protein of mTOR-like [Priapulus caudatus]